MKRWMTAVAPPFLLLANGLNTGVINIVGVGEPGTQVATAELVKGKLHPLGNFTIEDNGYGTLPSFPRWSCTRRTRRFAGFALLPDGSSAGSSYSLRTPSCRNRLAITLPARGTPWRPVRVGIRDGWRIGGVRARVCARGPRGGRVCRVRVMPAGTKRASWYFRPRRRGRWQVSLTMPGQRLARTLVVGSGGRGPRAAPPPVVLTTGDSMVQTLDAQLADRLGGRAQVLTQAWPGTAISKPGFDWVARARSQATSVQRRVTVVFLGANEGFDMTTPEAVTVACCDDPWIEEYSRRVSEMVRAYGRVVWIALPAPEDAELRAIHTAVNEGVRRAVATTSGARFLRIDRVISPGFQYRERIRYRGRSVDVRAEDGVHLSIAGSEIAVDLLMREPMLRSLR